MAWSPGIEPGIIYLILRQITRLETKGLKISSQQNGEQTSPSNNGIHFSLKQMFVKSQHAEFATITQNPAQSAENFSKYNIKLHIWSSWK